MNQRARRRDDRRRPHNPSEFGPPPPKPVGLISPLPKRIMVRAPNTDTFLRIAPGGQSASTGVLVQIA